MSDVIDLFSRKPVPPAQLGLSRYEFRNLAKRNDQFRRRLNWKIDIEASNGFMSLDGATVMAVFRKLKRSSFSQIDFGLLSEKVMNPSQRRIAHAKRNSGLMHVGKPPKHIVWSINPKSGKIDVCLASEYFNTQPRQVIQSF